MDFPGNTDKSKEQARPRPEKVVEKVVTGEVIQKPKSLTSKFKTVFFGGDFKMVARRVTGDVLLPAFRNLVADTMIATVERVIYGESPRGRNRPGSYRPNISYNNPLLRDPRHRSIAHVPDQPPRGLSNVGRRAVDTMILRTREEAELVVERMIDIIDKYEVVSYGDLLDLLGLPTSHVDNKWGWTYLNNIEIRQIRDGYLIELPDMEAI